MPLYLDTGFSARRGRHKPEHETCLVVMPSAGRGIAHGALLAVADDVAEQSEPGEIAKHALHALAEGYYASPEHWSLKRALHENFLAAHQAVRAAPAHGRAASLSALGLRRRRYVLGHAGDTRLWLWRDHEWKLLTRDHVTPRPGRPPAVHNACGLGRDLEVDFASGELAQGDVFVLTSRAVHTALDSAMLLSSVIPDVSAQHIAETLTEKALAAGAQGCLSACVVRIEQLPPQTDADAEQEAVALPIVPPPAIGEVIDGFRIEALIHTSRFQRLYRALDQETGNTVVLRFPNPKHGADPAFPERFLREEWIGRRLSGARLVRLLALRKDRRTALYSVMAHVPGETLKERLRRKRSLSARETVSLGRQLLEALASLHRQGVIHRDIRPKNLLLEKGSRRLLLLGLGTSFAPGRTDNTESREVAGNALSYYAPELLKGAVPDARTDIYAAGVTLYRLLTGKYPYGKIDTVAAHYGEFVPPSRYKADVPVFLEEALRRACALDPRERFGSAEEFAAALEAGPSHSGARRGAPAERPVLNRGVWALAAVLLAGLLVYLASLLR
jgi:protein phosphatase